MSERESFAAYLSSRVRGMKSELMDSTDMDDLIGKRNVDEIAQALLSSPYSQEMAEALSRYEGADAIEEAVSRNLITTFGQLLRACGGDYREMAHLFLSRWDLAAVKALLRNRHHELDAETAQDALVPGPSLPMGLLKELGAQTSMDALVRGLVAWNPYLCRPLEEKLSEYQSSGELRVLEEALDRRYFVDTVRRLSVVEDDESVFLKNLLRMEIDRINLRLLLEPRDPSVGAEDLVQRLLPRGRLPESLLRDMATQPPDRVATALEGTYYDDMAEDLSAYVKAGKVSQLERLFELAFLDQLKQAAQRESIGIAVLMRYAWLKYNEVTNLRMIARGADVHLAVERVQEELVYA